MQIYEIRNININTGRPSPTLTDKLWQDEFQIMRIYIEPTKTKSKKMGGKFSKGSYSINEMFQYQGATDWQRYCQYINDVLRNIKNGEVDYCYYKYQIRDLLCFYYDELRTRFCDGYWQVWLEV